MLARVRSQEKCWNFGLAVPVTVMSELDEADSKPFERLRHPGGRRGIVDNDVPQPAAYGSDDLPSDNPPKPAFHQQPRQKVSLEPCV